MSTLLGLMAKRLTVLAVEDGPAFLNCLCEILALDELWQRPWLARDGTEAMALLAEAVPDLVLLDLEFPKVDGLKILQSLRSDARFQRTAVVVTGARETPGPERAQFLPGEVWLSKPFEMDDLATAIRLAMSRAAAPATTLSR